DRRSAAEQPARRLHLARAEELADPRRRHAALALDRPDVVDDVDAEAERLSHRCEQFRVARSASAEAEVTTDEDRDRAERTHEEVPDEVLGRDAGQLGVEMQ